MQYKEADHKNHLYSSKAHLGSPCHIYNFIDKSGYKKTKQERLKAVQTVHSLHRLSQIYIICDNEVWSTTEGKRCTIVGVSDDPTARAQVRTLSEAPGK